ncbi:MAG TPA: adenosine kinase [Bacteroidales bacterium]|nr:adenosine kinase [Bacteroidales bacterium]HOH23284.1 adenosine kinase [Bacteroidales bacterium]HPB58139.1 adenosine kinase [Bacteroidales bacterium]HPZ03664.1 adenosine kinase [Bacteroidales bacterium]HQB75128.1 adenosine kinase [Bacteroidales bacterium]
MKKILGIGNALVDILIEIENDQILEQFGLQKGGMEMIDIEKKREIDQAIQHLPKKIASGGSTSNTIYGLARLGALAGYIGKIAKDEMGDFFRQDMINAKIDVHTLYSDIDTGIATTFISSNGERTFATYLGAASTLSPEEIDINILKQYDIIHVEGYLIFNRELVLDICKKAKQCGRLISMDMASYNLVESMHDLVQDLVENYVDIIFANEDEARAYTGKEELEALEILSQHCDVAVVKLGARGSIAKVNGVVTHIDPVPGECIDTTGAGDIYAAGFLYGLMNDYDVKKSGALASRLGTACIQKIGARLEDHHFQL